MMRKFAYTIIDPQTLEERSGMIDGDNIDDVFNELVLNGNIVREVRNATINDIKIERLKGFRNKMSTGKADKINKLKPKKSGDWAALFWIFVAFIFVILYLLVDKII